MNLIKNTPLILLSIVAFITLIEIFRAKSPNKTGIIFIILFLLSPLLIGALLLWQCPYSNENINYWRAITWISLGSILTLIQCFFWMASGRYESGDEFNLHIMIVKIALLVFAIIEVCFYVLSFYYQ